MESEVFRIRDKKELFYFALLLAVIPIIFFALGFVNYFLVKDVSQGNGFIICGVIATILMGIIFLFEIKKMKSLLKVKEEKSFVFLPVVNVFEEDCVLTIQVSYENDGKKYLLSSVYEINIDNISLIIQEKMNAVQNLSMKVFIQSVKNFEFDVTDFLNRLGISASVSLLATSYEEKE